MSFKGCRDAFPASIFLNLAEDNATATVVFIDEPEPREGTYMGKDRVQALFPVLDKDGLHVWPVGKTLCDEIEARWDDLFGTVVQIVRHGAKNDTNTKYVVKAVRGPKSLLDAAKALKRKEKLELWERVAGAGSDGSTPAAPPVDPDEPGPSDDEAPARRSRSRKGGQPQEMPT